MTDEGAHLSSFNQSEKYPKTVRDLSEFKDDLAADSYIARLSEYE